MRKMIFMAVSATLVLAAAVFCLEQTNRLSRLCRHLDVFAEYIDPYDNDISGPGAEDGGGGGFGYTNGCPGPGNRSQPQAVQCEGGGWVIKPGCCEGMGGCQYKNPCKGGRFKCSFKWCDI